MLPELEAGVWDRMLTAVLAFHLLLLRCLLLPLTDNIISVQLCFNLWAE